MKLFLKLEAPFEWVRVDGTKVTGFGEVPSLADYSINEEEEVVGVVPGEWVTTHEVSLPAKTKKQFNTALPYALEEAISEDVDNLHFVCPSWKSGEPCQVHVVAKEKMREWQALANHFRLPVQQLLPDHALLPFHDVADFTLAKTTPEADGSSDALLAASRQGGSVSIDSDLLDIWLMDLPLESIVAVNDETLTQTLIEDHPERDFRHWPFGSKMAHWLEYPITTKLDLWSDSFRPSVSRINLRAFMLPLAALGLAIFIKFAFDTYRYFALHAEIASIRSESQQILSQTFPEFSEVARGSERRIMEQAMRRLGANTPEIGLPFILEDMAGVLARKNVVIRELNFRNQELIFTGELSDFSQVDQIARELNARPRISVSLQSSESDEGKILASYKVTQAR